jgi:co-chaperonin GroES (HSP10)
MASNRGIVLAVGPGKVGKKGGRLPMDCAVGDTVLFYELAELHEPSGMTRNPFNRVSEAEVIVNEKDIQVVIG